jgi:hypothetical protein
VCQDITENVVDENGCRKRLTSEVLPNWATDAARHARRLIADRQVVRLPRVNYEDWRLSADSLDKCTAHVPSQENTEVLTSSADNKPRKYKRLRFVQPNQLAIERLG